jgi:hypothetical protein
MFASYAAQRRREPTSVADMLNKSAAYWQDLPYLTDAGWRDMQ